MSDFRKFAQFTKVDSTTRTVEGIVTSEAKDKDGERCHYDTTAPLYKEWSQQFERTTGGKSKGNIRAMHQPSAAGKVTDIQFDDAARQISIVAKIVDDDAWKKVEEGVYTGFSQGGKYVKVWRDENTNERWYTARPSEVSLVDHPANPDATFTYVKHDGTVELRKFSSAPAVTPRDVLSACLSHGRIDRTFLKSSELRERNQ